MAAPDLRAARLRLGDIGAALRSGYALFRAIPVVSIGYAAVFVVLGLLLLLVIGAIGVSPLLWPFAGGFMLVGPVLVTGYFELAAAYESGRKPRFIDALGAFRRTPPGLWLVALVCAFLFLIWITDAGVLYSMTVGGVHLSFDLSWLAEHGGSVLRFELWGSLMGSILAYMIFALSAFAVPLIYHRRAGAVDGVVASVRTVLTQFFVCLVWGLVLSSVIMVSILILPALLVTLPIMAYASLALYRAAFPEVANAGETGAGFS